MKEEEKVLSEDSNINDDLNNKVITGKIVLIIILGFNIFEIIYKIFGADAASVNSFIDLLDDTGIFFSIVCISFIVVAICENPFQKTLFVLSTVNIIIINKLYSNKKWKEICSYIKNFDYQIIFFIIFIVIIIGICIFLLFKNIKEYSKIKNTKHLEKDKQYSVAKKIYESDNINEKKVKNNNNDTNIKNKQLNHMEDYIKPPSILIRIIIFACACIIIWAIIDYISYEVINLNIDRPHNLKWLSGILWYIAIICASIILAIFIDKIIVSFLGISNNKTHHMMQIAAGMAILLEIALMIFTNQFKKLSVLDDFLSAVADNLFGILMVLIAIFLIFHIACLILFNFIFPKWGKNDLAGVLSKRVKKIEKNLVIFVCNLFDGIVALFYFIPDFFNTIGSLFMERGDLFPNDNDYGDDEDNSNISKNHNNINEKNN